MDCRDLYESSISFKEYVDKYCVKHDVLKENAFKHILVRSYADYIIREGRANENKKNNAN